MLGVVVAAERVWRQQRQQRRCEVHRCCCGPPAQHLVLLLLMLLLEGQRLNAVRCRSEVPLRAAEALNGWEVVCANGVCN
jgi:hypothetical protein